MPAVEGGAIFQFLPELFRFLDPFLGHARNTHSYARTRVVADWCDTGDISIFEIAEGDRQIRILINYFARFLSLITGDLSVAQEISDNPLKILSTIETIGNGNSVHGYIVAG